MHDVPLILEGMMRILVGIFIGFAFAGAAMGAPESTIESTTTVSFAEIEN